MGEEQIAEIIHQMISFHSSGTLQEAAEEWGFEVVAEVSSNEKSIGGFYYVLQIGIRPNYIEEFLRKKYNLNIHFLPDPGSVHARTKYLIVYPRR